MQIQDIVGPVSAKLGLDQATTEKAIGIIFSVLEHEADGTQVGTLFAKIPGAADLAHQNDVMAAGEGSGLLGSLASSFGGVFGSKAGALVNGITQLHDSGLDSAQIRQAGTMLVQKAEEAAGPELVGDVLGAVPGLKGHLGL